MGVRAVLSLWLFGKYLSESIYIKNHAVTIIKFGSVDIFSELKRTSKINNFAKRLHVQKMEDFGEIKEL